jgi:hypothetical protein
MYSSGYKAEILLGDAYFHFEFIFVNFKYLFKIAFHNECLSSILSSVQ